VQYEIQTNNNTIAVSGDLDFQTAKLVLENVAEKLVPASALAVDAGANSGEVVIDLAGVTHSNSAGLALLIEWKAIAQREKLSLSYTNIPESLRQISSVCQVDGLI